jgi:hypothetical protein
MVKATCRAEWVTREAMQLHGGRLRRRVSRVATSSTRAPSIFEGADETLCSSSPGASPNKRSAELREHRL